MKFNKQKVTDILTQLNAAEHRRLSAFLDSPFHVKPRDKVVYEKILKAITKNKFQTKGTLDVEKIWFNYLYPDKDFIVGKVEKKMSQFAEVLLKFLGYEEISQTYNLELAGLKALRTKGLSKIYSKEIKKVKRKILQHKHEWIDGSLAKFELDLEECRYLNADPAVINQLSYNAVYKELDNLYVHYFIYLGLRNLNYNNFIQPKAIKSKFEKLLFMLNKRDSVQLSKTQCFEEDLIRILMSASLIDNKKIEALSNQLEQIKNELNSETYKNYRTLIRSFTLAQHNSGDTSLGPFIFQLYKQEVENKSIFFENKIPSAIVNNIFIFGLREKKIQWLTEFLNSIEDKILEPNLNGFTIALNRAKLLFAQKRFVEVLDVLIFEVKNFYFKVHARILELMTYYELNDDQLPYKIDAYKIFIYRLPKSKIGKDFITGHNNFIRILRSICHTNTIYDLSRIKRLKSKIIATKILAEKQWLLEKVNLLEDINS